MSGFVGSLTGRVHVRFCWMVDRASTCLVLYSLLVGKCQVLFDG